MPSLTVTIPLAPAAGAAPQPLAPQSLGSQPLVTLHDQAIELGLELQPGAHSHISAFRSIGAVRFAPAPDLQAALRFSYVYHPEDGVLELFGNDHAVPAQATALLTRVGEHPVLGTHTTCGTPQPVPPTAPHAAQFLATPALNDALRATAREANDRIAAAAVASGQFRAVRVNTPPPSLDSAEEQAKWTVMMSPDGQNLGAFDPQAEYPRGTRMVNQLYSSWGGTVTFSQNENIANVIGSSPDPHIANLSWIELWERQFGMEDQCTSHNWASGKAFVCNDAQQSNRVGGHVILGTTAKKMPKDSNNVYISPICKNHNNNDNVYMRANVYLQGIWLKNYLGY